MTSNERRGNGGNRTYVSAATSARRLRQRSAGRMLPFSSWRAIASARASAAPARSPCARSTSARSTRISACVGDVVAARRGRRPRRGRARPPPRSGRGARARARGRSSTSGASPKTSRACSSSASASSSRPWRDEDVGDAGAVERDVVRRAHLRRDAGSRRVAPARRRRRRPRASPSRLPPCAPPRARTRCRARGRSTSSARGDRAPRRSGRGGRRGTGRRGARPPRPPASPRSRAQASSSSRNASTSSTGVRPKSIAPPTSFQDSIWRRVSPEAIACTRPRCERLELRAPVARGELGDAHELPGIREVRVAADRLEDGDRPPCDGAERRRARSARA